MAISPFDDLINSLTKATSSKSLDERLKSIDESLQRIVKGGGFSSQTDAIDYYSQHQQGNSWASKNNSIYSDPDSAIKKVFSSNTLNRSADNFLKSISKQLDNVSSTISKELDRLVARKIRSVQQSASAYSSSSSDINSAINASSQQRLRDFLSSSRKSSQSAAVDSESFSTKGLQALGKVLSVVGTIATIAQVFLVIKNIGTIGPEILSSLMDKSTELGRSFDRLLDLANRYHRERTKTIQNMQRRMTEDVNTLVSEPFRALKDASQALYTAWNQNIRLITGTQGYTKAGYQDLISSYAARLQEEGLANVVSSADITNNLSSVLRAGLSGQIAEEFAYQATKLGAAVPTQDFFSYASSYAAIAANAIRQGQSQTEAIQYANKQLEIFASNIVYASRQLSGGFSTGLANASSLFESSVKIVEAAKVGDVSSISSVLAAVSAATGAIAPDLANSMVNAVVNAAIGGNATGNVALRSLAGINASNTEFLMALARDPQSIFAELFSNLASMQTMSSQNFMEVAEGLSSVFGLNLQDFARVDFAYLADAISNMNVSNVAITENLEHLASGQTTTSTDQLKIAEINRLMIEEGLSYVIDNQAAQFIQQHMWDQEMNNQLMEATYGVEIVGESLNLLESIRNQAQLSLASDNIGKIVNIAKSFVNIAEGLDEFYLQKSQISDFLEAVKVGEGSDASKVNLTYSRRNEVVPDMLTLIDQIGLRGGNSYTSVQSLNAAASSFLSQADSSYTWGLVSKNFERTRKSLRSAEEFAQYVESTENGTGARDSIFTRLKDFIGSMEDALVEGIDYASWIQTSSSYGIRNVDEVLQRYGANEYQLQAQWQAGEVARSNQIKEERFQQESDFWNKSMTYYDVSFSDYSTGMLEVTSEIRDSLVDLAERSATYYDSTFANYSSSFDTYHSKFDQFSTLYNEFYENWIDYYVRHTAYSTETLNAYDVEAVRQAERKESGDAVLALANALTSNSVDLKDPVVQTNVLLSKILLVAEAIMQQNNSVSSGLTLPDSLAALALGMTQSTLI